MAAISPCRFQVSWIDPRLLTTAARRRLVFQVALLGKTIRGPRHADHLIRR
jgi:hypothetical protein